MSRNLAVSISIGAVLASSVMSTLGGVAQKFDGLNGKLKEHSVQISMDGRGRWRLS